MEKLKLIKDILGKGYASGEEHLFHCPYCKHHKRKFSVNIEKNFFKCWICDTRGRNLRRIVRSFGDFKQLQEWDKHAGREDITKFDDIFSF